MKNLTESQNQIIESIVTEFEKFNSNRVEKKFSFIGELITEKEAFLELKTNVEKKNLILQDEFLEKLIEQSKLINLELEQIGLILSNKDYGFYLGTIKSTYSEPMSIFINYDTIDVKFGTLQYTEKSNFTIKISGFGIASISLIDLFSSNVVKNKVKDLYSRL